MDRQNLQLEKLLVSKSVRLPLHRLDLVVRPFQGTGADREVVVRQQTRAATLQCLGHLLKHAYARGLRSPDPVREKSTGERLARLVPELPQVFLQVVGRRQRLVQLQGLLQTGRLVASGVEVLGGLEQEPA